MTEKDREMRDRDAARRLPGHFVTAMVRCQGRNGPRAVSAETFTAIGTTGRERTRTPRNRLRQDVPIHYAAGEVATLAWADGTRELFPVPRQRQAEVPTVPESEADELAAVEVPPERSRDSPDECRGGT